MSKQSLPDAVTRAQADAALPEELRGIIRDLAGSDEVARADAFEAFHAVLGTLEALDSDSDDSDDGDDGDDGDDDGDGDNGDDDTGDHDSVSVLRLFPAFIGLAGMRDDIERVALLGAAGTLELLRANGGHEIPSDLTLPWEKARLQGLKLLGPALASPVEPALLAPLLASLAALHGDAELGALIAGAEQLLGDFGDALGDAAGENDDTDRDA